MSHYSGGVDTGNALEKQVNANEVANREADDYRQLQMAALEKLDPNVRSKHAVLQSSGKSLALIHTVRVHRVNYNTRAVHEHKPGDRPITARRWIFLIVKLSSLSIRKKRYCCESSCT